jgi:hypothetical protein
MIEGLNGPLLWTVQTAMAIEAWRSENGRFVGGWLNAVSEIEALSALANYSWEHPEDPFPKFAADARFDGEDLGHPLLSEERCVRNSVTLTPPLQLLVVSGSNMSGKSTLLRAVGINAVLALGAQTYEQQGGKTHKNCASRACGQPRFSGCGEEIKAVRSKRAGGTEYLAIRLAALWGNAGRLNPGRSRGCRSVGVQ